MTPFQLRLVDLFWMTGLAACVVGAITTGIAEIAFLGLCSVILFVWRRPVPLRFWSIAVVGLGAGLLTLGWNHGFVFGLRSANLAGWGMGLLVGGLFAFYVFEIRKPPE